MEMTRKYRIAFWFSFESETNNIMYVAISLKRELETLCWAMGIFRCFQQLIYRDYTYVIGEENPDKFYKLADENPNRGKYQETLGKDH